MTRMVYHIRGAPDWHALMARFAELIYNGAPVARVFGRRSPNSLYRLGRVAFEGDEFYGQRDAESFIRLKAPCLRLAVLRDQD